MLEICEQLRERRIDLGFARMSEAPIAEDIEREPLFDDPLIAVVGTGSPWARRQRIRLAELANERWTWSSSGTLIDSLVVGAFRANGLDPPRAKVHTGALNLRLKLAATGRFIAVVSASALRFCDNVAAIKILPVELPTTHRQVGIVTLKNRTLSLLAQRFVDCAREIAKGVPKAPSAARRASRRG
jgi:DNA-binding transcriptional LysR family regulator